MSYQIVNKENNSLLASSARVAVSFFQRFAGLMLKKEIAYGQALIFYRAASIHTFFMRFAIDILFLDRQMRVVRLVHSLGPWRMVFCRGAYASVEMASGKIKQAGLKVGDRIEIKKDSGK